MFVAWSERSNTATRWVRFLSAAVTLAPLFVSGAGVPAVVAAEPDESSTLASVDTALMALPIPTPRTSSWTDSRCDSCHKVDALFSHPVGVTPSMRVPANLPLDNGRISCVTCHDNSDSALHIQARTEHTPMLRPAPAKTPFCAQCHNPERNDRKNQHAFALGVAHMQWDDRQSPIPTSSGDLDTESRSCLGCHDGATAKVVRAGLGGNSWDARRQSHPIGSATNGRYGGWDTVGHDVQVTRPSDKRVRLFNDRVGCGSCHSLFSTEKNLMVVLNTRDQLCLSCHPM